MDRPTLILHNDERNAAKPVINVSYQPEGDPAALKRHYLSILRRNQAAILEAASLGFDFPVKGCPGWDVAGLAGHVGRVYTFWLKWVRERPRGYSREAMQEIEKDRDSRLPGYTAWDTRGFPRDSRPGGILDFTRDAGQELEAALVDLDPADTVWTFVPLRQTGAFVFRRLAMETTIHRWDAEEAHGIAAPIDPAPARDGIDEMLMLFREDPAYDLNREHRRGQRILLREESGTARWLVAFDSAGIKVSTLDGQADAVVTGSAKDLWLYIMGRRTTDELRVDGDDAVAAAWGDLAGRF